MKFLAIATLTLIAGASATPTPAPSTTTTSSGTFEALPPNAIDGAYRGTLHPDGSTSWVHLGSPTLGKRDDSSSPLIARAEGLASTGAYCTGRDIDPSDVDRAIEDFANLCGGGHTFSSVLAIQHGGAIAYGCFYGGGGQTSCFNDRNNGGPDLIRRAVDYCGRGRSAWYSLPSGKVSYGVNNYNQPFC